ncbi:LytR C-terminal domain-containing protein [Streptacidiphilus sp. N1-12]|uniref:LytR C-terminal domain-containing protein n=2 Tax=Streptacidiphilus alkalitolerans TaxID=3342712 RepID=A0ABV6WJT2_9ACTN
MTGTADGRQPQQQEYDEWGRPLPPAAPYGEVPQQYGYQQQAPYGYDDYGRPLQQPQPPQQQQYYAEPGYEYPQQQPYQEPYQEPQYGQQPYQDPAQYYYPIPEQQAPPVYAAPPAPEPVLRVPAQAPAPEAAPAAAPGPGQPGYGTEQFTFVDDAEESADVIDWMKFSETRGERRDERRKRLRNRFLAGLVALVLIAGGTAGYLWAKGSLFASSKGAVAASTKRTVVAVHLHDLNKNIYTALLVSNPGSGTGATVLVPGALGVPTEGGGAPVPLGATSGSPGSADAQGNAATREGLNTLLGADITATWGLYTPFLQKLVDAVAPDGLTLDANTTITVSGKALVKPGRAALHGDAVIAYATYQAKGESPSAQLSRFGQVLQALVTAMPQDPSTAASDITQMGAVPDPSLPDSTLGALLAALSKDAKAGKYSTDTLAVKGDGTLGPGAGDLVKRLLGGQVSDSGDTATVARVAVKDATGSSNGANLAAADVVNGGFTLVPGTAKASSTQAVSTVAYTDDARAADAKQVAQDLGLPASAVRKVTTDQSVDVMVVLGKDFKG